MTITITIHTDGAAFDGLSEEAAEVSRILRKLSHSVEDNGVSARSLYDYNGNVVGRVDVERTDVLARKCHRTVKPGRLKTRTGPLQLPEG